MNLLTITHTGVILGKKRFVFHGKTLAFLGRRFLGQLDPRVKKIHCFSSEKQGFSSPRMTHLGDREIYD